MGGPTRSCGFSVLDTGGNWRRCYRSGQVEEGDARGGEGQALAALDRGIACHQDAPPVERVRALLYRVELPLRPDRRREATTWRAEAEQLARSDEDATAVAMDLAHPQELAAASAPVSGAGPP